MLSFFQHYMIRATSLLIFHLKQKPCHIISCSFFHHPKPTSKWLAFEAFKLISLWSSSCLSQPAGDQQGLWIFEFFALAENCALQRKISLFHAKLLEPKPFRFFSLVLMNIHVHESVKGLFCEQVATTLRNPLTINCVKQQLGNHSCRVFMERDIHDLWCKENAIGMHTANGQNPAPTDTCPVIRNAFVSSGAWCRQYSSQIVHTSVWILNIHIIYIIPIISYRVVFCGRTSAQNLRMSTLTLVLYIFAKVMSCLGQNTE